MTKAQAKIVTTLLYVLSLSLFLVGCLLIFTGIAHQSTRAAIIGFASIVIGIVLFRFGTSLLKEFRKD
jgi:small-conductance mechanosensitive channel